MRSLCLSLLILILFLGGNSPSRADSPTKRVLLHSARLTLEIPAEWQPSAQVFEGYQGMTGIVGVLSLDAGWDESCVTFVKGLNLPENTTVEKQTLVGQAACLITPDKAHQRIEGYMLQVAAIKLPAPFETLGKRIEQITLVVDKIHIGLLQTIRFNDPDVTPEHYLESALDWAQAHSYFSAHLNWPALRSTLLNRLSSISTLNSAQTILSSLIGQLKVAGDNHSFTLSASDAARFSGQSESAVSPPVPDGKRLTANTAFIRLYMTVGLDWEGQRRYAETVQTLIRDFDTGGAACWVVDLRKDSGGSILPMLVGLEPLIGDGRVLGFEDVQGVRTFYELHDGAYQPENGTLVSLVAKPYTLTRPATAIAVLIGPQTASAGEDTVLGFKGRANVRFLGEPTGGYLIGNTVLPLYDGALLAIATGAVLDRNGVVYTKNILPDETVLADSSKDDAVLDAAMRWMDIQSKGQCGRAP